MLSDYQALVPRLVRDDAGKLAAGDIDDAITHAVRRYSMDRPQEKVQDVTPSDANTLPLPAAWETDFSDLRSLEHPIGDVPPTLISQERYGFYRTPSALTIKLLDAVAVAANNVRVTFTIKHVVDAVSDTIPVHHREPVACWAAAILCDQLAAFYSGGSESSIKADSVEGRSKAEEYAARARTLRKRYLDELGIEDKRSEPAGVVVNLDQADSRGGDRLTHPAAYR